MTTQSWSSRVRHDSDATFREWGSELSAKLAAVGLTQTADTGQINWTTVTRPGINTDGGYEIWRFNDTQHSTAPIFMRFDYGTFNGTTAPSIKITIGTGSSGAGVITGTALTAANRPMQTAASTSDTARQSYMCYADGFFGLYWKAAGVDASFFICRTCDSAGAASATGAQVHWGFGQVAAIQGRQALRFAATAAAYTLRTSALTDGILGINPMAQVSSVVGSDIQVYLAWTSTPRVEPLFGICGVIISELAAGGTFSVTLVGSTARTYLTWPGAGGPLSSIGSTSSGGLTLAMLWE